MPISFGEDDLPDEWTITRRGLLTWADLVMWA